MQPGELVIYTDMLENRHETTFIRKSDEAPTLLVQFGERRIWIRESQAEATGKMVEPGQVQRKDTKGMEIGSPEWERLLSQNKRRKR